MKLRSLLAALVAAAAAAALPAGASAESTGPCLPEAGSPTCHFWTGKVTFIADGDTIKVDLDGDHSPKSYPVRFTGINAMELHRYSEYADRRSGDCHGVEAADRLEQLLRQGGMRVRLAAQSASSHSGHRLRRQVSVRIRGHWVDVNRTILAEGQALWLPNPQEYAWNRDYSVLAERARAMHVNLWNPTYCDGGGARTAGAADPSLRMWVKSDADGPDAADVNGEWVRIQNLDPAAALPIGGWWVRDSWLGRFTFPAGASIPPGATITLHVGHGTSGGGVYYWNRSKPIFENATDDSHAMGDGAYLFDPSGDVRASFVYPCRFGCSDPLQGALTVAAQPKRDESVTVTNVSGGPVDLFGYQLEAWPRAYDFPAGTVLAPGQQLVLGLQGSPAADTPLVRYWGLPPHILADRQGAVSVENYQGMILACTTWGSGSCTGRPTS
jgi:endonuclease YncB( thermonuclease family)